VVIANSSNTAKRIWKYHRNKAEILYPPVEVDRFSKKINFESKYKDYYIIVSMLAHYKKIEIAIEAFNQMPDKKLLIV
jgi:glycosyltransferase involved in cell wall biosynthesis